MSAELRSDYTGSLSVAVSPDRALAATRRSSGWPGPLLRVDGAMLVFALALAEFGAPRAGAPATPLLAVFAYPLLVLVLLALRGMYRRRPHTPLLDDLRAIATTSALAAMIVLCTRVFFTADPAVAQQGARMWAFAVVYLAGGRLLFHRVEQRARRDGRSLRPTLIIGSGMIGRLVAQRLLERPELGLRPIGFLDKEPLETDDGLPVLGASWDLERVVAEHGVEHVIVSFSTAPMSVLLGLMERAERLGLETSFVPRLYERTTSQLSVQHIGGLPLVTTRSVNPRGWYFRVKHVLDRIIALILVLLFSPVLGMAAAATFFTLGRPILFRQRRVGRDGVEFDMLKFRTMRGAPEERGEADAGWAEGQLNGTSGGLAGTPAEDQRSALGKVLRQLSIDELPQLFNVLLGHMSIVGPRPERVHYVRAFERNIYRYGDRHRVKSGITGWAQANGLRGNTSLADRVEWDNYYIENFSFWLDFKILLLTLGAVRRGSLDGQ